MTSKRKPNFFSSFPHGLFIDCILGQGSPKRSFCRSEEGDFIFHLLSEAKPHEVHVADSSADHLMTFHIKMDLLKSFTWNEFKEHFGGVDKQNRLEQSGRWLKESFSWHKKRNSHAKYLRDIESLHRLKTRLSKVMHHSEDFFEALSKFMPNSFDLIYLGRLLDEPGNLSADEWPQAIRSRLTTDGRVVVLTDQDESFMEDRMRACGFEINNRYDVDPRISALVFSSR